MKKLVMTTAMSLALASGAFAQTADAPAETPPADETSADAAVLDETQAEAVAPEVSQLADGHVPAFRASTFTGMTLYTLDPDAVVALRETAPGGDTVAWDDPSARWTSGDTFISGRDQWESVGEIDDIILTQDGAIRGVLIDVGGFLGIGSRTVSVDLDQLYFVADTDTPEDLSDFFVVAQLTRDQLETLPEWSDDQLSTGYEVRTWAGDPVAEDGVFVNDPAGTDAPAMTADDPAAAAEPVTPTADDLQGADVYDATGESIGSVNDLVLEGDSEITHALVDVGGFLGMGSHTVALPIEDLTVTRDADGTARVQTGLSREQLEAMPAHEG